MIIFKDIISGDELFTDASPYTRNEGMIKLPTKKVVKKAEEIDDALIGGNASQEEEAEATGGVGAEEKEYDFVMSNRLVGMPPFDKKMYLGHIKGYLKDVKAKMQENGKSSEDIAKFQKQAEAHVKKVVKKITEMEIYVGESMDADAMQVMVDYEEDGATAFAMFFEEGLIEEKV